MSLAVRLWCLAISVAVGRQQAYQAHPRDQPYVPADIALGDTAWDEMIRQPSIQKNFFCVAHNTSLTGLICAIRPVWAPMSP
jgi:hypothetical protein